jgi:hypothetical protein
LLEGYWNRARRGLIVTVSITYLPPWDTTAIEIALDVKPPRFAEWSSFTFSGVAEPRVCLVAGFALTSHLKHIVSAVDRALPKRLPSTLRIAPVRTRSPDRSARCAISVQPMLPLLRLQSKVIRAIEPGLTNDDVQNAFRNLHYMDEVTAHYIRDFVSSKIMPTFEPSGTTSDFDSIQLRASGVTMYQLDGHGLPQSIIAHWTTGRTRSAASTCEVDPNSSRIVKN